MEGGYWPKLATGRIESGHQAGIATAFNNNPLMKGAANRGGLFRFCEMPAVVCVYFETEDSEETNGTRQNLVNIERVRETWLDQLYNGTWRD
jgi:hypothetical protein